MTKLLTFSENTVNMLLTYYKLTFPKNTLLTNCNEPIAEVKDWGANVNALKLKTFPI